MGSGKPFDVDALYVALDRERRTRRLSWRGLFREADVADVSLITRLSNGKAPSAHNLVRLLMWLGNTDIKPYIRESS
jgi:hypothetical protein